MTLFAHPGHWIFQLLYLMPVVAIVVALAVAKARAPKDAEPREGDDNDAL